MNLLGNDLIIFSFFFIYLEDGRQRMAKHKAAHPGYHAKWRAENREEYNEYQRQYKRGKRKLDKEVHME